MLDTYLHGKSLERLIFHLPANTFSIILLQATW